MFLPFRSANFPKNIELITMGRYFCQLHARFFKLFQNRMNYKIFPRINNAKITFVELSKNVIQIWK